MEQGRFALLHGELEAELHVGRAYHRRVICLLPTFFMLVTYVGAS